MAAPIRNSDSVDLKRNCLESAGVDAAVPSHYNESMDLLQEDFAAGDFVEAFHSSVVVTEVRKYSRSRHMRSDWVESLPA